MTEPAGPRRWWRVIAVTLFWTALAGSWIAYQRHTGLDPVDAAQRLVDSAQGNWWAIGAYLAVSLLRPLVLFPATLVTVAAGMLFGPVAGIGVAAIGANASAVVGYSIGRGVLRSARQPSSTGLSRWTERLRRNGFEAVLVMRLVFLPYDLVNYGCGLLRVRRMSFVSATVIGTLPGTVAFVLLGASADRLDQGLEGIDHSTLIVSVALVVTSLVVARVVRRRTSPPG